MKPSSSSRAFRRLRWRQARNHVRALWQEHPLRLATPIATTTVLALMVFALSLAGFRELERHRNALAGGIISGLFDVLFSALGGMLLLSTGIILYASLFTSPEARYLLATPATAARIFATKFQSAAAFSSFGFLVLGFPILIAYGLVAHVSGWYLALLPVFLAGFALLPAALSSIVCLLLMRMPWRPRMTVLTVLGVVLILVSALWLQGIGSSTKQALSAAHPEAVRSLATHFSLASNPWLPGRWMSDGLLAAARGDVWSSVRALARLWAVGLVVYGVAVGLAGRHYRPAYDQAAAGGSRSRRRFGGHGLDRVMEVLVGYLDRPTRLLVVKDFRSFRRDPSQWALLVAFGLLLALGAGNFRSFARSPEGLDLSIIGMANLAGTAVLLCAGLSRFIFPLVSLEGRRFWILGLMPIGRRRILTGKFALAATASALAGLVIVAGTEFLLRLPPSTIALHSLTIVALAVGLSGLNVGLGACLANFRETDPSKIVVGPNGTINMVLGLLFLMLTLLVMAGPLQVDALIKHAHKSTDTTTPAWVYAGLPLGLLLTVLAAWIPLRLGRHALEQAEF